MTDRALTGASFALYRAEDYDDLTDQPKAESEPVLTGSVDADGILPLGEMLLGEYRLVETKAPEGFTGAEKAIRITVSHDGVTAMQGSQPSTVTAAEGENGTAVWTVRVWNNPGYSLPSTGGAGIGGFRVFGGALTAFACAALFRRRNKSRSAKENDA